MALENAFKRPDHAARIVRFVVAVEKPTIQELCTAIARDIEWLETDETRFWFACYGRWRAYEQLRAADDSWVPVQSEFAIPRAIDELYPAAEVAIIKGISSMRTAHRVNMHLEGRGVTAHFEYLDGSVGEASARLIEGIRDDRAI